MYNVVCFFFHLIVKVFRFRIKHSTSNHKNPPAPPPPPPHTYTHLIKGEIRNRFNLHFRRNSKKFQT